MYSLIYNLKSLYIMEPTKKPKVIYFLKDNSTEVEKVINEFLSEHDSISVKSIAMDESSVILLYEE
jgi:ribosomal protein L10